MTDVLTTKSNIRNVLKRYMAARFLDEVQLAVMAKVSVLTIKHILDEENESLPTIKTLVKISNALSIRISQFFIVSGMKPPQD